MTWKPRPSKEPAIHLVFYSFFSSSMRPVGRYLIRAFSCSCSMASKLMLLLSKTVSSVININFYISWFVDLRSAILFGYQVRMTICTLPNKNHPLILIFWCGKFLHATGTLLRGMNGILHPVGRQFFEQNIAYKITFQRFCWGEEWQTPSQNSNLRYGKDKLGSQSFH